MLTRLAPTLIQMKSNPSPAGRFGAKRWRVDSNNLANSGWKLLNLAGSQKTINIDAILAEKIARNDRTNCNFTAIENDISTPHPLYSPEDARPLGSMVLEYATIRPYCENGPGGWLNQLLAKMRNQLDFDQRYQLATPVLSELTQAYRQNKWYPGEEAAFQTAALYEAGRLAELESINVRGQLMADILENPVFDRQIPQFGKVMKDRLAAKGFYCRYLSFMSNRALGEQFLRLVHAIQNIPQPDFTG